MKTVVLVGEEHSPAILSSCQTIDATEIGKDEPSLPLAARITSL